MKALTLFLDLQELCLSSIWKNGAQLKGRGGFGRARAFLVAQDRGVGVVHQ